MCPRCPGSLWAQLSQQEWEAGTHLPVEQHLQQHPHCSFACSQVLFLLSKPLCSFHQRHPGTNLVLPTVSSLSRCPVLAKELELPWGHSGHANSMMVH